MSSFRKFHSIAALCGDGLRPELQALFERLAVDSHTELFVRDDGLVQSGPDPIAMEGSLRQAEIRHSTADGTPDVVFSHEISAFELRHYATSQFVSF
ncbi:hypothetical protein [Bradyrhizobium sp.]|uniref:hypothetical protein n=1 Tax=Bradyrhizobium sp. TaxID=376 RepID=UPI002DFC9ABC|nr:hypothetical protein [Bradyrhizobium sp.]